MGQALDEALQRETELRGHLERQMEAGRAGERRWAGNIEVLRAEVAALQGALAAARREQGNLKAAQERAAAQPRTLGDDEARILREAISEIGRDVVRLTKTAPERRATRARREVTLG